MDDDHAEKGDVIKGTGGWQLARLPPRQRDGDDYKSVLIGDLESIGD